MPPIPGAHVSGCACVWLMLLAGILAAFETAKEPTPPGYAQDQIISSAETATVAWRAWRNADAGLEQEVLHLPMREARERVERARAAREAFLEKRRAYSDRVSDYIDQVRAGPHRGMDVVTVAEVYQDHVQLLGLDLEVLEGKLNALRETTVWLGVRRGIQAERAEVSKLQAERRADLPLDLSIKSHDSADAISGLAYREAERQVLDDLDRLWKRYYQVLADTVQPSADGPQPLTDRPSGNALAGVWIYAEGSQQFNGVGEPRHVMLELWSEGGGLAGRYRAELPDFDGIKTVDLHLKATGRGQTFEFESKDPAASGRIVLEGPEASGRELMLIRMVDARCPIPRGREVLRRR